MEIVNRMNTTFLTVEELINILNELPKDYYISPFGECNCAIAVSDIDKRVYLDNETWLEEMIEED